MLLQDAQGQRLRDQIAAAVHGDHIAHFQQLPDEVVHGDLAAVPGSRQALILHDDAGPLRGDEALGFDSGVNLAQRFVRLQLGEVVDEFQVQGWMALQQASGAAANAPKHDCLVALQQGVDDIVEIAIAAGQDDDVASFGVDGVGQDVAGDADIGAVLARQVEDGIDVGHHQARGHVVGHFAAHAINQGRQGATPAPGRIGSHLDQLAMNLRLRHKALDQVIEIDHETLLVQADGDILEIDVDPDVLGLDAGQGIQRLQDDVILVARAGQDVVFAPHADACRARGGDLVDQGQQLAAGRGQDQLVDRIRILAEVALHQAVDELGAAFHFQRFVARLAEDRPGIDAGAAGRRLPSAYSHGAQQGEIEQAGHQRRIAPQRHSQLLQVDAPAGGKLDQVVNINDQIAGHNVIPKKK